MVFEEWTDNIWRLTSQGKEELTACYIVECGREHELVLIDTGINERMGREIVRSLDQFGSKAQLTNIFLTHSHPELLGGLASIKKAIPDVKIHVHDNAKNVFEEGRKYALEKQFPLGSSGKVSLAWKTPIFENYIGLPKPDNYLKGGEDLRIDEETFIIQHSAGHSSDSIIIHAYNAKATFAGDEIGLYNNNEYSFFFDLTGSPDRRSKALRAIQKLKSKYVFSSNISPIENEYLDEEVEAAILAQQHFETTLQETMLGYDSVRIAQLVDHVYQALNMDWKTPYSELKVQQSTIMQYLDLWKRDGLVNLDEKTNKWSYDREKLGADYDPYTSY
jgi:glyoxylase-like metal-dependent hydrolase (beta-lactamase superfamily II)